jgi:threonine aldolase
MRLIDLRSDTVTLPTPAMRQAIAQAEVGDDVYGEDPTVNRLQEMAASLVGKEAGLFVPSGTMSNLAAILAHCNRGDELILGNKSHTFLLEGGSASALGGIHSYQIQNQADGTLLLQDIENAIRPNDIHQPVTRLICLENTHNRCGGVALSLAYTRQVGQLARQHNLRMHLDGARLFNAGIAQGVSAKQLAEPADSVSICLSKGLSAPVGSVLCGPKEFIQRALRIRKQLGGGMRQAGILAAAGIVALETMIDRLVDDHRRAARLAEGLRNIPGLQPDPEKPYTNMVFLNLTETMPENARSIGQRLLEHGIEAGVVGSRRLRLVTHYGIEDADIEQAIAAFHEVL